MRFTKLALLLLPCTLIACGPKAKHFPHPAPITQNQVSADLLSSPDFAGLFGNWQRVDQGTGETLTVTKDKRTLEFNFSQSFDSETCRTQLSGSSILLMEMPESLAVSHPGFTHLLQFMTTGESAAPGFDNTDQCVQNLAKLPSAPKWVKTQSEAFALTLIDGRLTIEGHGSYKQAK